MPNCHHFRQADKLIWFTSLQDLLCLPFPFQRHYWCISRDYTHWTVSLELFHNIMICILTFDIISNSVHFKLVISISMVTGCNINILACMSESCPDLCAHKYIIDYVFLPFICIHCVICSDILLNTLLIYLLSCVFSVHSLGILDPWARNRRRNLLNICG